MVLIIVAAVLLFVGVAYGLFRYFKKKRLDKNVSLLTEKEEEDSEERPERVGSINLDENVNETLLENKE